MENFVAFFYETSSIIVSSWSLCNLMKLPDISIAKIELCSILLFKT